MLDSVACDYLNAVLSVLGSQLIKLDISLTYNFNANIDVFSGLLYCSQLEELSILPYAVSLASQAHIEFLSTENFLPRLKRLEVSRCLEVWSRLFECHRPALTSLYLACPHFGMVDRSSFNWIDIPQLFPNLQEFHIDKGEGLSLNILHQFVPQLKHLKSLTLSPKILSSDENLKFSIEMRQQYPNGPVLRYEDLFIANHD